MEYGFDRDILLTKSRVLVQDVRIMAVMKKEYLPNLTRLGARRFSFNVA